MYRLTYSDCSFKNPTTKDFPTLIDCMVEIYSWTEELYWSSVIEVETGKNMYHALCDLMQSRANKERYIQYRKEEIEKDFV